MSWFTRTTEPTTIPQQHSASTDELEHLEELRRQDRLNKRAFDAAFANRDAYERTHKILDAVSIIRGSGFVRVGAAKENPALALLYSIEETTQRHWWAGRKQLTDEERRLGVIR